MPRGPKGERRAADVNAVAILIARIATGEVDDAGMAGKTRHEGAREEGRRGESKEYDA
jgi:hypothetical protein